MIILSKLFSDPVSYSQGQKWVGSFLGQTLKNNLAEFLNWGGSEEVGKHSISYNNGRFTSLRKGVYNLLLIFLGTKVNCYNVLFPWRQKTVRVNVVGVGQYQGHQVRFHKTFRELLPPWRKKGRASYSNFLFHSTSKCHGYSYWDEAIFYFWWLVMLRLYYRHGGYLCVSK